MTSFDADLDDVRVHDGDDAPADLAAAAFTEGSDVYLEGGGDDLLAHEVTHVVQQGDADSEIEVDGV